MNPEAKKRLVAILAKDDSSIEAHDLRFLRARSSYLSREQAERVNRLINANEIEGLKIIPKDVIKNLGKVVEPEVEEVIEAPIADAPIEEGDEVEVDDVPVDDSGEVEVIEDEDEVTTEVEGDEVDLDEMNLDQLKSVAKELGIKGVHFYKDADALREKILSTYETSNEGIKSAEAEPEVEE
jgi:hypothetical protein